MTLKEFVSTCCENQEKAAEILGVSQGMVSHWLTGRCEITPKRALSIEEKTKGKVTRHDLLPEFFGSEKQNAA